MSRDQARITDDPVDLIMESKETTNESNPRCFIPVFFIKSTAPLPSHVGNEILFKKLEKQSTHHRVGSEWGTRTAKAGPDVPHGPVQTNW